MALERHIENSDTRLHKTWSVDMNKHPSDPARWASRGRYDTWWLLRSEPSDRLYKPVVVMALVEHLCMVQLDPEEFDP